MGGFVLIDADWVHSQESVRVVVTVTIHDGTGLHGLLYRHLHHLFSPFQFALLLLYVLYVSFVYL